MRIIVSYAADSGYMPDKTNGFKLLEPIGLVRIGLAAAVVVTASTTEEEKNERVRGWEKAVRTSFDWAKGE